MQDEKMNEEFSVIENEKNVMKAEFEKAASRSCSKKLPSSFKIADNLQKEKLIKQNKIKEVLKIFKN